MANSVVQTIRDAEIDARSLSEFVSKGPTFTVTRRLAPTIHTLDYYLLVLNEVKEKGDLADIAISDTLDKLEQLEPTVIQRVEAAINNTAVEGGVLADTFVTVTASGENKVARSQRAKNNETVSVLDFYNPAMTDYTEAFNNALNYLSNKGGGSLFVPAGIYEIDPDVGIVMKSNTSIFAQKGAVVKNKPHNLPRYEMIRIIDVENVTIYGLEVDGNRSNNSATSGEQGHGFSIRSATNVMLDNIVARNCWGDGVLIANTGTVFYEPPVEQGGKKTYSERVYISNSQMLNNRRQGITVGSLKHGFFSNLYISGTNGTPPEAAIDFEPDRVYQLLENINIDNLVTENNTGTAITINTNAWRSAKPDFELADNGVTESDFSSQYRIDRYIEHHRNAATHKNKISITIKNWMNVDGLPFIFKGSSTEHIDGFVKIQDSVLRNTTIDPVASVGYKHAYAEQVYYKDCEFIQTVQGASPHSQNRTAYDDGVVMGGFHHENVIFSVEGDITISQDYPIRLYEQTQRTSNFANVTVRNCKGWHDKYHIANFAFYCPALVEAFEFTDGSGHYTSHTSATSNLHLSHLSSKHVRPDDSRERYTKDITRFGGSVGSRVTFSNELVSDSSKLFILRLSKDVKIVNLERDSGEESGVRELRIPAGSRVEFETLGLNKARISHIDEVTLSNYYNTGDRVVKVEDLTIPANSEVVKYAYKVNLHEGALPVAVASTHHAGLVITAGRFNNNNQTIPVWIKNVTDEPITWSGTIKIRIIY